MLERMIRRQRFLRLFTAWLVIGIGAGNCGVLFAMDLPKANDLAPLAGWWLFFVCLFVFIVVRTGWRISLKPERHPFLRQLISFGDAWTVLRDIDTEIAASKNVHWTPAKWAWRSWPVPQFILLTPSWLVQVSREGVTVVFIPEIVWVFKRTKSLIADWGSQRIVRGIRICCDSGRPELVFCSSEKQQDEILDQLLWRKPEILAGFQTKWRQIHRDDADRLAEVVEKHRRDWKQLSSDERSAWHSEQLQQLDSDIQHVCLGELDPFSPSERQFRGQHSGEFPREPAGPALGHWVIGRPELELNRVIRYERIRVAAASVFVFLELVALGIGSIIALTDSSPWVRDVLEPLMICGGFYPGLVTLWLIWRFGFRRFTRGLNRELAAFDSPREVIVRIDAELRNIDHIWLVGRWSHGVISTQPDSLMMTRNWLLRLGPGGSTVIHLPDVFWVWKRVVPRFSFLSRSRNAYHLGIGLRSGEQRLLAMASEAEGDRAIEELLQRMPVLMTGWQGKWLDLMAQGPMAIEGEYQARQKALESLSPSEREAWLDESWDQAQRAVLFVDPSAGRSGPARLS